MWVQFPPSLLLFLFLCWGWGEWVGEWVGWCVGRWVTESVAILRYISFLVADVFFFFN